MSVLIKGGRIITAGDDYVGDVFVEGETVSLIGRSLDVQAEKVIDARGKYVIPGAVDPHTHMEMPFGGTNASDTFETGTRAAAEFTVHGEYIATDPGVPEGTAPARGQRYVLPAGAFFTLREVAEGEDGPELFLRASVTAIDGSDGVRGSLTGPLADAAALGRTLAADLLDRGAVELMAAGR